MKDHLSVSQIQLYMNCSLKYKFKYIDGLPRTFLSAGLALGSAVHSTIEWFNRKRFNCEEMAADSLLDLFEADWYAINCETVLFRNGETQDSLLDIGRRLVQVYFNNVNGQAIAAVEYPFEVQIVDEETGEVLDLPLVGRFDLIEQGPVVVDLKTSARKMGMPEVEKNIQLTAYSYAYWMKNGRLPDMRLDVLVKNKTPRLDKMPTSRNQTDHRRFFLLAKQVFNGIKKNIFFPNPSWMCTDCEYRQACWMYNGLPS